MRITKIEYDHTLIPNASCGTGYSEPSYWKITYENGSTKQIVIDLWYTLSGKVLMKFTKAIKPKNCDNFEEAYMMFIDEAYEHGYHYDKDEQRIYLTEFMNRYRREDSSRKKAVNGEGPEI